MTTLQECVLLRSIERLACGSKANIPAGGSKYLDIDSGTLGAAAWSIVIGGVVGAPWTVDVYVPSADGVAAPAAADKRDSNTYTAAMTEAGLLIGPISFPYNMFLVFNNNAAAAATISQVIVMYTSKALLVRTWET